MAKGMKNPTKVVTGRHTIFSYLNVNEPKTPMGGGTPKYSVSLIIPKSDTVTIAKIRAAIQAAYDEGQSKLKGNSKYVPALEDLKTPLRDGDKERKGDEAYKNAYFVNANSTTKPGVVDADCQPILDTSELYSGTRASHADSTTCRSSLTAHRSADTAALRMTSLIWMMRMTRTSCPEE